ncbi:hypothetical protein [Micromonospora aurantiaca]|uniref:hypothetical protein n=1 Tax=Micromonospora aurantiaca (nom. illeg.) TaxID=47850 RepID=UPI0013C3089D|nr:hypothetical protein [Micromonospora aurantiaca]
MLALIVAAIVIAVGLLGPADGLTARINRAVYRIVGTATPLAVGALLTNLGVLGGGA